MDLGSIERGAVTESDAPSQIDDELLDKIRSITAKRPKTVLDHIVKYGSITTEELRDVYGYDHPPRAARDVRDHGIELETVKVRSTTTGRTIAAYVLPSVSGDSSPPRAAIPAALRKRLLANAAGRCAACAQSYPNGQLQIDHRIPFGLGTSGSTQNDDHFQVLCRSCQRSKSWTCEHCPIWTIRDGSICQSCYWYDPDNYSHIATIDERRVVTVWRGSEVSAHQKLNALARESQTTIPDLIKMLLEKALAETRELQP